MKKIVLAFSGGLDTSFCIPYLIEQGYEVHTLFVNTGGISISEEKHLSNRAIQLGAKKHKNATDISSALCFNKRLLKKFLKNLPISLDTVKPLFFKLLC